MDDLHEQALSLQAEIEAAAERVDVERLLGHKRQLDKEAAHPGFWQNTHKAQETTRRQAQLEQRLQPWLVLRQDMDDVVELLELNDLSMRADLSEQLNQLVRRFATLKDDVKFAGPYDD